MILAAKAGAGETEAQQVPGGGEEGGDVEQRFVRDAVAEQPARRVHCRRQRHAGLQAASTQVRASLAMGFLNLRKPMVYVCS